MKILGLVIAGWMSMVALAGPDQPTLMRTSLEKVYVPVGFDTNDVPQVYVKGRFKDTCHQVGPISVSVDRPNRRVTLSQQAYRYASATCWPMVVPYDHVVNLPVIETEGNYEIVDGSNGAVLGSLNIAEAPTSGPGTDSHIYAPIEQVLLKREPALRLKLVLTGSFPNSCMAMKTVKLLFQNDVVVVMPIVEMRPATTRACVDGSFPFYEETPLNRLLGQYPYLFHVRSMAGQSVNRLIDPYTKTPGPIIP
jgi:hypothetical protein